MGRREDPREYRERLGVIEEGAREMEQDEGESCFNPYTSSLQVIQVIDIKTSSNQSRTIKHYSVYLLHFLRQHMCCSFPYRSKQGVLCIYTGIVPTTILPGEHITAIGSCKQFFFFLFSHSHHGGLTLTVFILLFETAAVPYEGDGYECSNDEKWTVKSVYLVSLPRSVDCHPGGQRAAIQECVGLRRVEVGMKGQLGYLKDRETIPVCLARDEQ